MTILERWVRRGNWTTYDALWRAACWEAAAEECATAESRKNCLARATAIMQGEL